MSESEARDLVLIIGLGNPGEEYAATRHNVGFMVLKELVRRHGLTDRKGYPPALVHSGAIAGHPVELIKPRTYMNLSGQAARWAMGRRGVPPERILVIVDDFALDLGRLRLRSGGSAGGHNGLKSLIAELETDRFPRLRLGVGPMPEGQDTVSFVLGAFRTDEQADLRQMLTDAADCVESWIDQGTEATAARFNSVRARRPEPPAGQRVEPLGPAPVADPAQPARDPSSSTPECP